MSNVWFGDNGACIFEGGPPAANAKANVAQKKQAKPMQDAKAKTKTKAAAQTKKATSTYRRAMTPKAKANSASGGKNVLKRPAAALDPDEEQEGCVHTIVLCFGMYT